MKSGTAIKIFLIMICIELGVLVIFLGIYFNDSEAIPDISINETNEIQVNEIITLPAIIETTPIPESTINPHILIYEVFLEKDQTDEKQYSKDTKYEIEHSCGHFVRQLCKNASYQDLPLGGVLLSSNRFFKGTDNHAMAYFKVGDEYYFIEAETDRIVNMSYLYHIDNYEYLKFYSNGNVPTHWGGYLQADIILEEIYGDEINV